MKKCSVLTKVSKEYPRKIAMRLEALNQTSSIRKKVETKKEPEKEKKFTLNGYSTWKEMAKPQSEYEKSMMNRRMAKSNIKKK